MFPAAYLKNGLIRRLVPLNVKGAGPKPTHKCPLRGFGGMLPSPATDTLSVVLRRYLILELIGWKSC